ncbi:4-alpha-glucanotransferase [uncultured Clostridium sp.]|uniref:4-alpha-glucanotransferase n=1 Tax=uncultured Clostridium sp. TaxID=59620 RepID=UPI002614F307|nr:4-alpha-glucanotransferase [uncultured Clostridium sp.]
MKKRSSGILMHISSLPGRFGIGSVGKEAYDFVDFLVKAGQKYWQILPLGHTSYGDSPYQCFSAFAGNPHFIDLDILKAEGLLEEDDYIKENFGEDLEKIDYGLIFEKRNEILNLAYLNFKKRNLNRHEDFLYKKFKKENSFWLEDYSEYMAIKDKFNLKSWLEWDEDIKNREQRAMDRYRKELKEEMEYYKFIQFIFFKQWNELKEYANYNGVEIIGDLPIYVAADSADMWSNKKMFKIDENDMPKVVAGCPPDAFAVTGQLWGNPIYDWDEMDKEGYTWWISRIKESLKIYDMVRIDHFRGFESYWEIPYGDTTAENGEWVKGPGIKLFNAIKEALGEVNIIAEDLGFMTDEVIEFRKETGFPGMKVLQFGFGGEDSGDLPHNYEQNTIAYLGTHDNDTIMGWTENLATKKEIEKAKDYLNVKDLNSEDYLREIWKSVSFLAVVTMQDLLGLGSEARMNTPSVLGGNWQWRVKKEYLTDEVAEELKDLTVLYGRI